MNNYSVLIPLGHKVPPEFLQLCLQSIADQTVKPSEVVFVCDHPTPHALKDVVTQCLGKRGIACRYIDCTDIQQRGGRLGAILARGVTQCACELIARMDADDIAPVDRCERQLQAFEEDASLALVGGAAAEFSDSPNHILHYRWPPESCEAIVQFAKFRNPFNHSSVMFRKSAVLKAGNYNPVLKGCEDYCLWYKIIASGQKVVNLPQVLLYSRADSDMFRRRQNPDNTASSIKVKKMMLKDGFITRFQYLLSLAGILFLRHAPLGLVQLIYRTTLRSKKAKSQNHVVSGS
ncbi:MAG: glycosyltransferase [Pyramidobacter sp.]|jgi:glycosyltransferase involved in cell wall biosynthesis